MPLLSVLDRQLRTWHVATLNCVALVWFAGVTLASQTGLPGIALFRCPIGFCAGGYSPEDLYSLLDEIGADGRTFLTDTILRADLALPALLLLALSADIVWFSRVGARVSVPLHWGARLSLLAVPVLYCIVDYIENAAIARILRLYPDIDDTMATRASHLTAAKSQLVAASIGIAATLGATAWGLAVRARWPSRTE